MSRPTTTRQQALSRIERTSTLTHLVASLEHLFRPAERRPGGMNNWEISRDATLVGNARAAPPTKGNIVNAIFWVAILIGLSSAVGGVLVAVFEGRDTK